jgi:hypothetical protein
MNILRFSNRSGLVKLKEHQMQDKITDFFATYCQIFISHDYTRILTE